MGLAACKDAREKSDKQAATLQADKLDLESAGAACTRELFLIKAHIGAATQSFAQRLLGAMKQAHCSL